MTATIYSSLLCAPWQERELRRGLGFYDVVSANFNEKQLSVSSVRAKTWMLRKHRFAVSGHIRESTCVYIAHWYVRQTMFALVQQVDRESEIFEENPQNKIIPLILNVLSFLSIFIIPFLWRFLVKSFYIKFPVFIR